MVNKDMVEISAQKRCSRLLQRVVLAMRLKISSLGLSKDVHDGKLQRPCADCCTESGHLQDGVK